MLEAAFAVYSDSAFVGTGGQKFLIIKDVLEVISVPGALQSICAVGVELNLCCLTCSAVKLGDRRVRIVIANVPPNTVKVNAGCAASGSRCAAHRHTRIVAKSAFDRHYTVARI